MSRNKILVVAAGATLVALAVYFFGQSFFERQENVRVERVESDVVSEGAKDVRKVRTEVLPTKPGDEGRAAQRDEEEKKAERP